MAFLKRDIDFMGLRNYAFAFSIVIIVGSLLLLFTRGLNYGLDFTGGTIIEVEFAEPEAPESIREHLRQCGFGNAVVQFFGTDRDLLIRMPPQSDAALAEIAVGACAGEVEGADADSEQNLGRFVEARLRSVVGQDFEVRRSEFVGPAVGAELREQGGLAILAALGLVLVYVLFRFTGKLALGAILALLHDPIVTLGFFALFQWDFDLSALAAVLAVMGYSINDTIVVADRIRENFRLIRRGTPAEIVNTSINQTLDRTIMTSFTTAMTMLALLLFGGEMVATFSLAMIIGIAIGTYSSIYISATSALMLGLRREDLLLPVKEAVDDGRP